MSANASIFLTETDNIRLRRLLLELTQRAGGMLAGLASLREILEVARVVQPESMPPNVVTMNSRVRFEDMDTQEQGTVTVVYPADLDPAKGKISVLSPVGAALLGETEGSAVQLPLPNGQMRRIRITGIVYQPEAHGHFSV